MQHKGVVARLTVRFVSFVHDKASRIELVPGDDTLETVTSVGYR